MDSPVGFLTADNCWLARKQARASQPAPRRARAERETKWNGSGEARTAITAFHIYIRHNIRQILLKIRSIRYDTATTMKGN
jgi:hypothetical protein